MDAELPDVLIAGAGIGGLAAALAVRQAGFRARVFEREPDARELGFALLLAPNAMSALRRLGIADEVRAAGVVIKAGEMRRLDGTVLRHLDTASVSAALGEDTVCVLRPALHGVLLRALGADALELSARATGFESGADGVTLLGQQRSGSGGPGAPRALGRGRLLIGADGVGSAIRRELNPGEAEAERAGFIAVRGVARDAAEQLGGVSAAQYFGPALEAGATRATATDVYWFVSLGGVREPLEDPSPRALLAPPLRAFHAGFRALVAATPDADLRVDDLRQRAALARWGEGPVTLLGDAAHPMLPHAGQGAAQALEDAVALGLALRADGAVPAALRRYESLRRARAQRIVDLARRNARVGAIRNPVARWLRDVVIRRVPERFLLASLIDVGKPPHELEG